MSKILLKLERDWADEFQCEQFILLDNMAKADKVIADLKENGGWFGTNECWEPGELSDDDFSVQVITDEDAAVLIALLGGHFGTGPL